ncbi:MAG: aromatic amino acid lyase [Alphaproteobacteria bacterium]
MTVILNSRRDVTLAAQRRVAFAGENVRLGPKAMAAMERARASFMDYIDGDPDSFVYGVTSWYGEGAKNRLSVAERKEYAKWAPHDWTGTMGERLPERVARAIVLSRLTNFVEGHAAISPKLARLVAAMLKEKRLPPVSVDMNGSAGEIIALGALFDPLSKVFVMQERDFGCLINGSPAASALVGDVALLAGPRLALAEQVFALSAEAFNAPMDAYDPVFDDWWGDPYEAAALKSLRRLLKGGNRTRRPYQAPVSYRILPRVLGQGRRVVAQAEEVAAISLSAVSDNPVWVMPCKRYPKGTALSNGGYHNAKAYPAIDNVAAMWADLCLVADRQTVKLHREDISLQGHLTMSGAPGFTTHMLRMVQVAYGEAARHAAQRTFLPGSGDFGQNDVTLPTFQAWDRERRAATAFEASLALLAASASQALATTGRKAPRALNGFLETVRQHFPPMDERKPRRMGEYAERLRRAFAARVLADAAATPAAAGRKRRP